MRIIKPKSVIMAHDVTPYEFIEKVGRTCYKSEDKITEGSAVTFVRNLIKREHWAMLEHETVYLLLSDAFMKEFLHEMDKERAREDMYTEPLAFFKISREQGANILSGSFRAFHDLFVNCKGMTVEFIHKTLHNAFPVVYDAGKMSKIDVYDVLDCEVLSRSTFIGMYRNRPHILFKHLTHTVMFTCDRGVSHEFVRHRPCSFAQESTRYCNYHLDKFGGEITVIKPFFWDKFEDTPATVIYDESCFSEWRLSCERAERAYFKLIKKGATPQEARAVLPNSLKTELIMTATEYEWQHIVNLRYIGTTGAPHPQMKESMGLIVEDLARESEGRIKYEV